MSANDIPVASLSMRGLPDRAMATGAIAAGLT